MKNLIVFSNVSKCIFYIQRFYLFMHSSEAYKYFYLPIRILSMSDSNFCKGSDKMYHLYLVIKTKTIIFEYPTPSPFY